MNTRKDGILKVGADNLLVDSGGKGGNVLLVHGLGHDGHMIRCFDLEFYWGSSRE